MSMFLKYLHTISISGFSLVLIVASVVFVTPIRVEAATTNCASQSSSATGRAIVQPVGLPQVGCGSSLDIVARITRLVFAALAMFSLLFIVIGGLRYTASGGDSNAIATAKKTILYAVIGFVLGISVYTIISLVISQVPSA